MLILAQQPLRLNHDALRRGTSQDEAASESSSCCGGQLTTRDLLGSGPDRDQLPEDTCSLGWDPVRRAGDWQNLHKWSRYLRTT